MNLRSNPQPTKKRVVIVTIVMALIVLGLLIAVISVAVQKNQKPGKNVSGEVSLDSTASSNNYKHTDPSTENLAPVSNDKNSGSAQSSPVVVVPDETKNAPLPSSGPTDILPLILLAGTATTYLVSLYLARATQKLD